MTDDVKAIMGAVEQYALARAYLDSLYTVTNTGSNAVVNALDSLYTVTNTGSNAVVNALAEVKRLVREVVEERGRYREALVQIQDLDHDDACKYKFAQVDECPSCPSAEQIAEKALGGRAR